MRARVEFEQGARERVAGEALEAGIECRLDARARCGMHFVGDTSCEVWREGVVIGGTRGGRRSARERQLHVAVEIDARIHGR